MEATTPVRLVRVGMAPRAAGLSPAECQAHWRSQHADAASGLPGLRAYVQNHAVLRDGRPCCRTPGSTCAPRPSSTTWAAMDAAFASETYQGAVIADERSFSSTRARSPSPSASGGRSAAASRPWRPSSS